MEEGSPPKTANMEPNGMTTTVFVGVSCTIHFGEDKQKRVQAEFPLLYIEVLE